MLYIFVSRMSDNSIIKAEVVSYEESRKLGSIENRNDWKSFEAAKEVAAALGAGYHATDAGPNVSPRYDVQELPKVGDAVSYAFNGDYYPCGHIKSISKSLKVITTTEGQKFYRRGETGCWKMNGMWSLVSGHISKLNPEF